MKRPPVVVLALLGVLAAVVGLGFVSAQGGSHTLRSAPAYSAYAIPGGRTAHLSDLRGQAVLLNRWATWCTECRDELPALNRLAGHDRRAGLRVIGVSIDANQPDSAVEAFVRDMGLTYAQWRDPTDRFKSAFKSLGVPESVLISRDGKVLHRWQGPIDLDSPDVRHLLQQAVRVA